jgi:hypothetical protein
MGFIESVLKSKTVSAAKIHGYELLQQKQQYMDTPELLLSQVLGLQIK